MRLKLSAFALLLATTTLSLPAAAQDGEKAVVLDPLVLRAGVEKVASQVPQSVSVIDSETLDQLQPGTIGDVLATVPGVAGNASSSFFGQGFNIRGFGGNSSAASEAGIVQLIDGEEKYYESYRQGSLFVEPDFLKRVEVLRGPGASTLYGSGALGGVIAMETIDAGDLIAEGQTSGGKFKLGYASNPDTVLGSIAWGWRPTDDFEAVTAFAWRKLGESETPDGDTLVRMNSKTPNLLLKAKKTFGDHYVEASYQHLEAKGDDQDFNQIEGAMIGWYPGFSGWGVGDITTRDQVARLVWGYNPADNRYIDSTVTLSYTNTIKDIQQGNNPAEPIMASLLGKRDYRLWKLKAQNVADLSGAGYSHFLTVGAEALKQDRTSSVPSASHPEAYTRAIAAFAWSEMEWGRFSMNSGLRYERQKTEPKDTVSFAADKKDFDSVEPQVALMYRLTDTLSVFGSVAYVNRMPSVDELYDGSMAAFPNENLKDEKGKNIEIGLSYRSQSLFVDGDEAAVKLTLFRNHIDDMIVREGAGGPSSHWVNIDRAYLRGGELEASYLAGDWQLGAAFSVVNGEDQDGATLDTLPNNRVVLSAVWQVSSSWKIGARSTLANGRDKASGARSAGYGVHDIFAIWSPQSGPAQGLEVNLGIDNVTDREYTPATWLAGPAPGRNVKVSLSKRF